MGASLSRAPARGKRPHEGLSIRPGRLVRDPSAGAPDLSGLKTSRALDTKLVVVSTEGHACWRSGEDRTSGVRLRRECDSSGNDSTDSDCSRDHSLNHVNDQ